MVGEKCGLYTIKVRCASTAPKVPGPKKRVMFSAPYHLYDGLMSSCPCNRRIMTQRFGRHYRKFMENIRHVKRFRSGRVHDSMAS